MKLVPASIVLVAACGAGTPPAVAPVPAFAELGTTHATTSRDINPHAETARERARQAAPATAQRLVAATNELTSTPENLEHTTIVNALQRLADAIALVAPDQRQAILRVRESAQRIEQSGEHAPTHTAFVRVALEAAARALRVAPIPGGFDETDVRALRLRDSADAAARAATALDPATPLSQQSDTVKLAMRESTRAVYAALGEPEPVLADSTTARR